MAYTKAQLITLADTHIQKAAAAADRYDAAQTIGSAFVSDDGDNLSASAHAEIAKAAASLAGLVA